MAARGEHLLRGDRRFATGGNWLAKLAAPAHWPRVSTSSTAASRRRHRPSRPPDGATRRIGFRAAGPAGRGQRSTAGWRSFGWQRRDRSAGTRRGTSGEWSSPDPVAIFELFSRNASRSAKLGRAKGPFRWFNSLAHRRRDNGIRKARANISAHYDLGNDFYAAWLDSTMTYSSALVGARRARSKMRSATRSTACSTG